VAVPLIVGEFPYPMC